MTNYQIKYSKEFKKSLKKQIKQGKNVEKLFYVIDMLSKKEKLESKYRNHRLIDDRRFFNCFDCHIEPDWILVYKYLDDSLILLLVNTGSHSEVLDK